jgi:hypothetical protein
VAAMAPRFLLDVAAGTEKDEVHPMNRRPVDMIQINAVNADA